MDIALEHALQRDYPALYSDCRESHFWCEDGWYPLLRALSQAVETYCQENDIGIHVTQVKQKFGTLRYYHGYDSTLTDAQGDELSKIVDDYCDRSRRICEKCGLPGTLLVSGAYWHVACPEHADGGLTPGVFQQLQEAKFKRMELPRGDGVDIPEAQIERNLFSGFTHAALVAHLARRLRVYDNRATVDLNLQADYQPPLLLEIERGTILRQSMEPLPWWAEILRDVALGADMGVDMDALYH